MLSSGICLLQVVGHFENQITIGVELCNIEPKV
jgi:hypothetical protein